MPSDYMLKQRQKKAHLYANPIAAVVAPIKPALGKFDEPIPGFLWGIDLSHWSDVWDFEKFKAAGGSFVIIKYMDGKLRTRFAKENYRGAQDAGVMVSSYHWLRSAKEVSPGGQAREYAAMLKDYPVDFVPWVDFESAPTGKKFNATIGDLQGFQIPFEDAYGRFGIYTSWGYWNQYGSSSIKWVDFPLWQARYGKSTLNIKPWGNHWDIWQYAEGGNGILYGSKPYGEKSVDMNVFRGTLEDLRQL